MPSCADSTSPVPPPPPEGLRRWRPSDAPALAAAWADADVAAWNPVPAGADPAAWLAGEPGRWERCVALDLVVTADDDRVVGEVGLSSFSAQPPRAELGVWLAAAHRGRGLASTAVGAVTAWALAPGPDGLGLAQVWARTEPANAPSEALFARLGWQRLGDTRDRATGRPRTIWAATSAVLR